GGPREGTVGRDGAVCLCCRAPIPLEYIRTEGKAGRVGNRLLAIACERSGGRVYVDPIEEHQAVAALRMPEWAPDTKLPEQALGFRVQGYGMRRHSDLFTPRQLTTLSALSALISEATSQVLQDSGTHDTGEVGLPLHCCGGGAAAYAEAVAVYLG